MQDAMTPISTEHFDLAQARVALIANGKAGRQDTRDRIDYIRARLSPIVRDFTVVPVRKGKDLARVAHEAVAAGNTAILALGGDGTQSAVAGALAGSAAVMGVLPGGTFNYFARELGTETLEAALDAVAAGIVRTRDLGRINDRIFINNASFGLYPQILARREDIYRRWGRSRIAAYWSVLVAVRNVSDPMHLSVTLDQQQVEIQTPLAFVARSAYQLDSLALDGAEAVRNGQFALFVAKGRTRRALIGAALRLALGQSVRGEDFELLVAQDMRIESRTARKLVALDGEKERMAAPFHLSVLHDALRVFAPADPATAGPAA